MYIALYDINFKHITNITNITFELIERIYDMDTFIANGFVNIDVRESKFLILKEETGDIKYFSFVDDIRIIENNKVEVKGLDPIIMLDNDILLDYTAISDEEPEVSKFSSKLKDIIDDVMNERFALLYPGLNIKHYISSDLHDIDTIDMMPNLRHQYLIVNAKSFIDPYLRVFQCMVKIKFKVNQGEDNELTFEFVKNDNNKSINLVDFRHELTTTNMVTNAAMATITFDTTYEYELEEDEEDDGIPRKSKHRSDTIAEVWYFLRNDNEIEQVPRGKTPDHNLMVFPIRLKMFEDEWLAKAQIEAVYELAKNRYADNIIIENNAIIDPIDFSNLDLLTMIQVYYDGKEYKNLPITEKTTTFNVNGRNTKIKLGFKKTLLTEIIKGG